MSEYYIAYEESVPWNGSVFNANEYRRAINSFYSKIDLVKPNATVEDGAPPPNISIKNLSPDANFPNEWDFIVLEGQYNDKEGADNGRQHNNGSNTEDKIEYDFSKYGA